MLKWTKYPSILSSGKQYFYVGRYSKDVSKSRYTVCWDRLIREWNVSRNEEDLGNFSSKEVAINFAERAEYERLKAKYGD